MSAVDKTLVNGSLTFALYVGLHLLKFLLCK